MIRPACKEDSPGIVDLVTGILAKEFPTDQAAYAADDLKMLMETYGGSSNAFFVAEEDRRIVGTCGVKAEDHRTAILRRLFVDPRYRGRGIGLGLLKQAIGFCRGAGFQEVLIRTSTRMEQAIGLCKRLGFQENGRWALGATALVRFRLRLT